MRLLTSLVNDSAQMSASKLPVGDVDQKLDTLVLERRTETLGHLPDEWRHRLMAEIGRQGALLHLLEVEHLVDEREQPAAVALHHPEVFIHLRMRAGHHRHDLLERTDDERDGSAYLMGHDGEELQLGAIHLLCLVVADALELLAVEPLLAHALAA